MKAAVYYGQDDIRIEEMPVLRPDRRTAHAVRASGICGVTSCIGTGRAASSRART